MPQDKLSEVRVTLEGFKTGPLSLVHAMIESGKGCFFEVPLILLCHLEYLASLYFGCWSQDGSSRRLVAFIRHCLGQVDEVYSNAALWLVEIFRHGTVHEFQPKQIDLPTGLVVSWRVVRTEEELTNASIRHLHPVTRNGVRRLPLALDRFRADFCRTIDILLREAAESPEVLERIWAALQENKEPEKVEEGRKFTKADIEWLSGQPLH